MLLGMKAHDYIYFSWVTCELTVYVISGEKW